VPGTLFYQTFTWTSSDGTQHMFPMITREQLSSCGASSVSSGHSFATDSSGFHMWVTNTTQAVVYAPDGTQVYPTAKDSNGNYFSTDSNSNVIDTLGRTPVKVSTTNCASNQVCYDILNSQGGTSRVTVTTASVPVSTAFAQSGVTEYTGNITVVQSIQLPDSNSYSFSYDTGTAAGNYGLLTGLTLPTGGQVTYAFTTYLDASSNNNRWVSTRISSGGTWTYSASATGTCTGFSVCQQVTVAKPNGSQIVYSFGLNNGAWKAQALYKSGGSPNITLKTVTSQWNTSNPCTMANCTGNQNIQELTETVTFPTPTGSVTRAVQFTYDSIQDSNITQISEWNYYAGTQPTSPDRTTSITYLTGYPNNLINRPTTFTVKTGGGTALAQTNIVYDSYGTGGLTSVTATQHDDANFSTSYTTRGNSTQIQRCTVVSPSCSSYLTTTLTYNITGQVTSSTDPAGNQTTFGYGDTLYNDVGDGPSNPPQVYNPASSTNAYLTKISPPLIPASTFGYYYGTGQIAPTGANNDTSYLHFYDSMNRPTSAVLPNGGWSYSAYAASETQVDTYVGITSAFSVSCSTGCRHGRTILDPWGRLSTQTLVSDPEGATSADNVYDTSGRVQSISHPHRSTTASTDGVGDAGL